MTGKEFMEKLGSELEIILKGLPEPLLEPIWYPGIPAELEKLSEFLSKLEQVLRKLGEPVVRALCVFSGAAGRIRTCDHRIRNPMLYPLSHGRLKREL